MDCRNAHKLSQRYLDEELQAGAQADLREHLATCEHCSRMAQALEEVDARLGLWQAASPRRSFADFKAVADAGRARLCPVPVSARWATAGLVALAMLAGGYTGATSVSTSSGHSHSLSSQQAAAAEAMGLDAFGDGLGEAILAGSDGGVR